MEIELHGYALYWELLDENLTIAGVLVVRFQLPLPVQADQFDKIFEILFVVNAPSQYFLLHQCQLPLPLGLDQSVSPNSLR